jgi:hypothetical protein
MNRPSPSGHAVVAIFAAVLLTQTACSKKPTDACVERVSAQCKYAFTCCEDEERISNAIVSTDYVNNEQECVDRGAAFCRLIAAADDSAELGRLAINVTAQDECLAKIGRATEGCDIEEFLSARQLCGDLFEPLVEDGDECALDVECKSGTCDIARDDDGNVDIYNAELGAPKGDCLGTLVAGDTCLEQSCSPGFFCGDDGCEALRPNGEPCTFDECEQGLECFEGQCRVIDVDLDNKYCTGRK